MSRQTPRKQRGHNRLPSHSNTHSGPRLIPASDYESDAAVYMDSHPAPNPALLHRTNTDLNLSVLRRYLPSINSIISIAANAVVYTFATDTPTWDKTGIEGTYFLCMQDPAPGTSVPRACIFVLNRRGLENLILDLNKVADFEVMDEIYIFRLEKELDGLGPEGEESEVEGTAPKVIGIWIHADQEDTRAYNAMLVQETWSLVQVDNNDAREPEEAVGPAMQAMGRKLSLSDLFGPQHGVRG